MHIRSTPNPRSSELARALISQKVPEKCRDKLVEDLVTLDPRLLSKLKQGGVEISTQATAQQGSAPGTVVGGEFNRVSSQIEIDQATLMSDQGRTVLFHEIGHYVDDAANGRSANPLVRLADALVFSSKETVSGEAEFKDIYHQFQGKSISAFAGQMRAAIHENEERLGPGEGIIAKGRHPFWGQAEYLARPESDKADLMTMKKPSPLPKALSMTAIGLVAAAGAAISDGPVGMVLGAFSGFYLTTAAVTLVQKPENWTYLENDIFVSSKGRETTVLLPKDAEPPTIGWTDSAAYLASSNKPQELFAEGFAALQASPQSRQKLQTEDRSAYTFIQAKVDDYLSR